MATAKHLATTIVHATAWAIIATAGIMGLVANIWLIFALLRMG